MSKFREEDLTPSQKAFLKNAVLNQDFIPWLDKRSDSGWNQAYDFSDMNGTWDYNGGVLAIVVDGIRYVTPLVKKYSGQYLESLGLVRGGIAVPFNGLMTFPGYLSYNEEYSMCFREYSMYKSKPSDTLKGYYKRLQSSPLYQKWNALVKIAMKEKGYDINSTEVPEYHIHLLLDRDMSEYDERMIQEIEEELARRKNNTPGI